MTTRREHGADNPLGALLELRERVRDVAERAVSEALVEESRAVERRDREQQAVVEAEGLLRQARDAGAAGAAALLQQRERFVARRREELERQLRRRDEAARAREAAAHEVAERRAALGQAQVSLEVAGKAAERWDAAKLTEARRKAELELEEVSAGLRSARGAEH
jgi:hypothetical protein